jgi:transcriptional regulator with XRE-family HTH domain
MNSEFKNFCPRTVRQSHHTRYSEMNPASSSELLRVAAPGDLGPAIRARRRQQSLRSDDTACLSGVSVDLLSRLENGKGSVPLDKLLSVLDGLGLATRARPQGPFLDAVGLAAAARANVETMPPRKRPCRHDLLATRPDPLGQRPESGDAGLRPLEDRWALDCDPDWVATAAAFPLSPALPLEPGYVFTWCLVKDDEQRRQMPAHRSFYEG